MKVEWLPEVSSFGIEANSLMGCAATMGLEANELKRWKNLYCDIEFVLFTMQTQYQEKSSNSLKEAAVTFNSALEQPTIAHEKLLHELETIRLH